MPIDAPLYQTIIKYTGERFHMPGHNGLGVAPLYSSAPFDITELSFSDNLLYGNGIISEAEALAAQAYKVKHTLFFTSGGTSAIHTALCALKETGADIIVLGDCHAAVYNGLKLFGIPFSKAESLDGITLCKSTAVITTSPDVYGNIKDIRGIREAIGDRLLIVDEAHGAHFAFSRLLPRSATAYADIVVNSMHKTMPVYTGGALLHTNNSRLYTLLKDSRKLVHTTSPSYLVMASMDYARAYYQSEGERLYKEVNESVAALRLPEGYRVKAADDRTRLVISTGQRGKSTYEALERQGVYAEMHDKDSVVFIVTPLNKDKLNKVVEVLREAHTSVDLNNACEKYHYLLGKRAKQDIGLYPPCIPVILKGELITQSKLDYVMDNIERAYGLDDE